MGFAGAVAVPFSLLDAGRLDLAMAHHGEDLSRAIAIATDTEPDWVFGLPSPDFMNLSADVIEANEDFFKPSEADGAQDEGVDHWGDLICSLVGAGFGLPDVLEMTIAQARGFFDSSRRRRERERAEMAVDIRIAFGAEARDFESHLSGLLGKSVGKTAADMEADAEDLAVWGIKAND